MKVFTTLASYQKQYKNCVATIGKYDGMHLGHQKILKSLLNEAHRLALPSLVILSEPQPEEFFSGENAPVRLSPFQDKVDFLKDSGIDIVYCLHFNLALSQLSPEQFIDQVLLVGLGTKSLIVGDDFRFGKDRAGDFVLLQDVGQQHGFFVTAEKSFLLDNVRVSSSFVRECLKAGDCETAKNLLGRYFTISGEVVVGQQLGRGLGAPTANIKLETKGLPLQGIFAVRITWSEKEFIGVASIGYNPTIEANLDAGLEVYIFDFEQNIYGEKISVSFLKKIREEKKFSNLEELKTNIALDVKQARKYFNKISVLNES